MSTEVSVGYAWIDSAGGCPTIPNLEPAWVAPFIAIFRHWDALR